MHFKPFFSLLILISSFSINAYEEKKDFSHLSNFLEKEVNKGRYPGFLTLIKKNGDFIYSEVVGFNDFDKKIPLKKDSCC